MKRVAPFHTRSREVEPEMINVIMTGLLLMVSLSIPFLFIWKAEDLAEYGQRILKKYSLHKT